MTILPAISLWQPWASLIAVGLKRHETRHWRYPERLTGQRVLIHAAKRAPPADDIDGDLWRICGQTFGRKWWKLGGLPRGAFLCTAVLGGCFGTSAIEPADDNDAIMGNWSDGRFAWRLDDVQLLPAPIPASGHQGWWTAEVGGGLIKPLAGDLGPLFRGEPGSPS